MSRAFPSPSKTITHAIMVHRFRVHGVHPNKFSAPCIVSLQGICPPSRPHRHLATRVPHHQVQIHVVGFERSRSPSLLLEFNIRLKVPRWHRRGVYTFRLCGSRDSDIKKRHRYWPTFRLVFIAHVLNDLLKYLIFVVRRDIIGVPINVSG
jgi:hypothetical protein